MGTPCCKKFTTGCPSCSQPIGRIRCLAVEKMIESIEINCQYAHHSCKSMLKLSQREEHEKHLCEYRPIQCPVRGHRDHDELKSQMTIHLLTRHSAKLARCRKDGRSASFRMSLSEEYMVLEFKEKWLLFHCCTEKPLGARLYCMAYGRSKHVPNIWSREFEVAYKLRVEPVKLKADSRTVVYNMEAVALDYYSAFEGDFDYLFIPHNGVDKSNHNIDVTVTLA